MNYIKNKIKLIIWDLDETFWRGTLSEEGAEYIQKNHDIIIALSERGIINSICSKNELSKVECYLSEKKIWDYFVFSEISWNPKGKAVKSIIRDMALRPENVLFIDDNLSNLNEVEFENPNISVCEPSIINSLLSSEFIKGKKDNELSRLKQYKILEKKREVKKNRNLSNIDFLNESNINITLSDMDDKYIERVSELIERTNQLNYTKLRTRKEDLIIEINSENVTSGVVSVRDKYGSYGISGFYLIKNNELKHFLFSCRTMNMGVENWVYKAMGSPKLNILGDVATILSDKVDISYINKVSTPVVIKHLKELGNKYLLMGGCDLDQVVHYLSGSKIETEFNFVNKKEVSVHIEHTELILQDLDNDDLSLIQSLDIYNGFTGDYKLYESEWDVLIYSPLNDYSRGLYQHKERNVIIPFDSFNINWTNKDNLENIPTHLSSLSIEFFEQFSMNFNFIGAISPSKFYSNLEVLVRKFKHRKLYILTGSEILLDKVDFWELGMEQRHKELNLELERLATNYSNVELVDVRKIINKDDHGDNLRHYNKLIYAGIADEIVRLEGGCAISNDLKIKGKLSAKFSLFKTKFKNKLNIRR